MDDGRTCCRTTSRRRCTSRTWSSEFPDGATAALFYVNNDFGQVVQRRVRGARRREQHRDRRHPDDRGAGDRTADGPGQQHRRQRPRRDHGRPARRPVRHVPSELVNAKAANPGWEPRVYITNTCASPLILGIAGAAANGLITSVRTRRRRTSATRGRPGRPGDRDVHRLHDGAGRGRHDPDERRRLDDGEVTVAILRPGRRVAGRPDAGVDHQRGPQLRVHPVDGSRRHHLQDERRGGRASSSSRRRSSSTTRRRRSSTTSAS